MREVLKGAGCTIIVVLLALIPRVAQAQFAPSSPFESDAPQFVHNFGDQVRRLNQELDSDFIALGAFDGGRRVDKFDGKRLERPTPWTAYGRLGPLNFQNVLEAQRSEGTRWGFRRTGPRLTGRVYFGIHRTFD